MQINVLKSKIHTATVTGADLYYEGSIVIDEDLMDEVGMREYEKVLVANFNNGNRYETYVIKGERGSGAIAVNGGGARYSCVGDIVTIFAFAQIDENETLKPKVIVVDKDNKVKLRKKID